MQSSNQNINLSSSHQGASNKEQNETIKYIKPDRRSKTLFKSLEFSRKGNLTAQESLKSIEDVHRSLELQ